MPRSATHRPSAQVAIISNTQPAVDGREYSTNINGNQLIKRSLVQLGVSELQTTVTVSISTIMSTASSCQPTITGSATIWKRVNSRVKTVSGAKPCVFSGNVAPGVAEVGSLFPRFRGSIWESCWQKAHRTVAIARLALQNRRNTFGKKIVHKTVARAQKLSLSRSEQPRVCAVKSQLSALCERWSIWHDALAMQVCNQL